MSAHTPIHPCTRSFPFPPLFPHTRANFSWRTLFFPPTNPAGRRLNCLFQRQPFCCFPPSFPSWEQRRVCIGACVHGDTGCGRILYAGSACSADTWTGVFLEFTSTETEPGIWSAFDFTNTGYVCILWVSAPVRCKGRDLRFNAVLFIGKWSIQTHRRHAAFCKWDQQHYVKVLTQM